VPPLRIWQLSQMALSGMLAGLLRQPKTRKRGRPLPPASSPEEDPRILKKRIVELERKLKTTEDLVRVLRDLPWAPKEEKEASRAASEPSERGSRTRRGAPASPRASTARRSASEARDTAGAEAPRDGSDGRVGSHGP
jgi:hypothetical protein